MRKGCTMTRNSVRASGTRVGRVCHHFRVQSVSSCSIVHFDAIVGVKFSWLVYKKHIFSARFTSNARMVAHSSHSCTTGAHRVTSHCAPFSRMCASTYEVHMPNVPAEPQRVTPKLKMALYWVKVGPKRSQYRSTLRKTVQNGSNPVKIGCRMGAPLALIREN